MQVVIPCRKEDPGAAACRRQGRPGVDPPGHAVLPHLGTGEGVQGVQARIVRTHQDQGPALSVVGEQGRTVDPVAGGEAPDLLAGLRVQTTHPAVLGAEVNPSCATRRSRPHGRCAHDRLPVGVGPEHLAGLRRQRIQVAVLRAHKDPPISAQLQTNGRVDPVVSQVGAPQTLAGQGVHGRQPRGLHVAAQGLIPDPVPDEDSGPPPGPPHTRRGQAGAAHCGPPGLDGVNPAPTAQVRVQGVEQPIAGGHIQDGAALAVPAPQGRCAVHPAPGGKTPLLVARDCVQAIDVLIVGAHEHLSLALDQAHCRRRPDRHARLIAPDMRACLEAPALDPGRAGRGDHHPGGAGGVLADHGPVHILDRRSGGGRRHAPGQAQQQDQPPRPGDHASRSRGGAASRQVSTTLIPCSGQRSTQAKQS